LRTIIVSLNIFSGLENKMLRPKNAGREKHANYDDNSPEKS